MFLRDMILMFATFFVLHVFAKTTPPLYPPNSLPPIVGVYPSYTSIRIQLSSELPSSNRLECYISSKYGEFLMNVSTDTVNLISDKHVIIPGLVLLVPYRITARLANQAGAGPTTTVTMITGPPGDNLDLGFQITAWVISGLLFFFGIGSIIMMVQNRNEYPKNSSVLFDGIMFLFFMCVAISNALLVFGGYFNAYFWICIGIIVDNIVIAPTMYIPKLNHRVSEILFVILFIIGKIILVGFIIVNIILFGVVGYLQWQHILFLCAVPIRIILLILEFLFLNELIGQTRLFVCCPRLRFTRIIAIPDLYVSTTPPFQDTHFDPIHHQKTMSAPPATWDNQDILEWLSFLGLERYITLFEKRKISGSLLLKLTVDDLEQIGIRNLVHQRSFVAAIEALNFYNENYKSAPAPCGSGIQEVCDWLTQTINCPQKYVEKFREHAVHGVMLPRITDNFLIYFIRIKEPMLRKSIILFVDYISVGQTNVLNVASLTTNPFELPLVYWSVEATALYFTENGGLSQYQQAVRSNYVSGALLLHCYRDHTLEALLGIKDSVETKRVESLLDPLCAAPSSGTVSQDIHKTLVGLFHRQENQKINPVAATGVDGNSAIEIGRAENEMCDICFERAKMIAFKPCGHFRVCEVCANQVSICPWCKKEISEKIRIFA